MTTGRPGSGEGPPRLEPPRVERRRGPTADRFERLLSAGLLVFSQRRLDAVLQQVVDSARSVVGARYAALGVLAPGSHAIAQLVTSGLSEEQRRDIGAIPQGRGLLGLLVREPKPIRTADIGTHPAHCGFPPHHPAMRSFLGVPITAGATVFGNLYVTEKIGAEAFTEEDERTAVLLAAYAAAAIENARLHEASESLVADVKAMQRQRDLYFAMMNHELRNALTGVYGWSERAAHAKQADGVREAVLEVYDGAERTIRLLNNFLDLARLEAGKVRAAWKDGVDVGREVERALASCRPVADAKRVTLEYAQRDAPPALRTDPERLGEILVNLLSNAIRYSPDRDVVTIAVETGPADLRLRVTDHGPGIPPELHERIFEPFDRGDLPSGSGAGLGLVISRRLAKLLSGTLVVESAVGRGATFILTLPLAPPTPASPPPQAVPMGDPVPARAGS